jgi:hypothetical protein
VVGDTGGIPLASVDGDAVTRKLPSGSSLPRGVALADTVSLAGVRTPTFTPAVPPRATPVTPVTPAPMPPAGALAVVRSEETPFYSAAVAVALALGLLLSLILILRS